jgi:hypothetical protein
VVHAPHALPVKFAIQLVPLAHVFAAIGAAGFGIFERHAAIFAARRHWDRHVKRHVAVILADISDFYE